MRAVFPLTPNEDLKAGQYWFANRTSDPDVAPAQADDLAPAQIASVTQSVCIFFLSVAAAASFFWAIPVCALPSPTLSGAVEYRGMLTSGEGEYHHQALSQALNDFRMGRGQVNGPDD